MTRALVVHHDIDLADQEVDSLRRLGYEVVQCSGPTANTCPVLSGHSCLMAEEADVLVYDAWASGDMDGSAELIAGLRRIHPDTPVVLTVPGVGYAWENARDPGVVELGGQPTGVRLDGAIRQAIAGAREREAALR